MKIKLEYFNLGAGMFLCIAGIIYFFQLDYVSGLNWTIFGSMYLAMDSYTPCDCAEKTFIHRLREVFGVSGFVLSIALLIHLL